MRLWLAEKADAGQRIAKSLGGGRSQGNRIDLPNGDVVTWASGHLLETYMPEEYDPRYKKWTLDDLPIIPQPIKRKPRKESRARDMLATINGLLKKASTVVIATDPGREGEGIARQILAHCGWKGPLLRLMTSSLAQSHLDHAVKQLIDAKETEGWGVAANFRQSADWIDGINFSRFYGIQVGRMGETISAGRVQSATLSMIVDRDREIENFKPDTYFELKISLNLQEGPLTLVHAPPEKKRIKTQEEADKRAKEASHQVAELEVKSAPRTLSPPNPFSLPELQIATSAKWKWNASKCLQTLQALYESGRVTYPRTDSAHLNDEMVKEVPAILRELKGASDYRKIVPDKPVIRKSVFDSSKVGDHHAIIPTGEKVTGGRGSPDEEKLYDLVVRRFLASIMPDAKGETTTIRGLFGGHEFKATGLVIAEPGWKAAYEDFSKKDDEPNLPPVANGKRVKSRDVEVLTKATKPPAHYTDGTLIKAMVAVGAKNPDAEIRDLMSKGIGTQATRHSIIETLKGRAYIVEKDRKIISTQRGREFIDILRSDGNKIADPLATAEMEKKLNAIEKDPSVARQHWSDFVDDFINQFKAIRKAPPRKRLTAMAEDAILQSVPARRSSGKGTPSSDGSPKSGKSPRRSAKPRSQSSASSGKRTSAASRRRKSLK